MSAYEENLQARREKLRDLVSNEEANLTREIAEVAQRNECARFEEMLARTEELRKRQDEEREAIVAAKQMQQYRASNPDIRQELSRRCVINAKRCNVEQMADNEARRLAEKKLDAVCYETMLKESDAKRHKEAEESERRALARQETVSTLVKQVADKLALEDKKKRVERDEQKDRERLCEDMRRAELKNLEMEKQKRVKLKEELEEQILTAHKFHIESAREEAMIDRMFITLVEEELARERVRVKRDTTALRAELNYFQKYLKDLQREKIKRNLEMAAIIQQVNEDTDMKRKRALEKTREARQLASQEVLRTWEKQLMTRKEELERAQRLKMEEQKALERQIQMDADLIAAEQKESRQKALRYGLELKEQQRCVEMTRRHEFEEERRYYRAEAKRQAEEYQRHADELLNASESITPHPFKAVLKARLKDCAC